MKNLLLKLFGPKSSKEFNPQHTKNLSAIISLLDKRCNVLEQICELKSERIEHLEILVDDYKKMIKDAIDTLNTSTTINQDALNVIKFLKDKLENTEK